MSDVGVKPRRPKMYGRYSSHLGKYPFRKRAYDFICSEVKNGRGFPPTRLIRQHMGHKTRGSIYIMLAQLARIDHVLVVTVDPLTGRKKYSLPESFVE